MDIIDKLKNEAIANNGINVDEALALFIEGADRPFRVMAAASEIREHYKERKIILCGIINAKSGKCPENCTFCAQSAHYETGITAYPFMKAGPIIAQAEQALRDGAEMFGLVTSGKTIRTQKEWAQILQVIGKISDMGLKPCASLGIIDYAKAAELKAAGLYRYHHNMETSRSYFPSVCTTHSFAESMETVRAAKKAGLTVCSGGIIGLGEGITHRIELADTLRELDVDSVPVNILTPIKGTPLARAVPLRPLEILMTICVFRFMLPARDIKLCGGKEQNLRQLLPLAIVAGANSLLTGDYLTTAGRNSKLDHEMIADLGLQATREATPLCHCTQKMMQAARRKTMKKKK